MSLASDVSRLKDMVLVLNLVVLC